MRSKDNKGFSLIELIVAVMIMGIVAGGAIMAISIVHNARTESAARVLSNVLRQARQTAVSMANTTDDEGVSSIYLHIYSDNDIFYADLYKDTTKVVEEKIGNDTIGISLRKAKVTDPTDIEDTVILGEDGVADAKIYFKKSTGGISKITFGPDSPTSDKSGMNEIYITGLGEDRKIILVSATGRGYYAE